MVEFKKKKFKARDLIFGTVTADNDKQGGKYLIFISIFSQYVDTKAINRMGIESC